MKTVSWRAGVLTVLAAVLLTACGGGGGSAVSAPAAATHSTGSLDATFGQGGKVTTAIGTGGDEILAVAVQQDGRIVAVGDSQKGASFDFAVARYNTDGSLDTTFNLVGKATTTITAGTNDEFARAVAIQADGKIVVAGDASNGVNTDFALVRYNTDGSLDTGFNLIGKVTTTIGTGNDSARGVAIQQDGKIVAAGRSFNGANYDFAVARYNTDGSLDTSFNLVGTVTTTVGSSNDYGQAVAIQQDGKIVVAGYSMNAASDIAVVRYNTDGSLDAGFNSTGKVITPVGASFDNAYALAIQPDGKIVVAGSSSNGTKSEFLLVRYNTDGSLDTGFNGTGIVTTSIGTDSDSANALAIQADGKIVAAGDSWNAVDDDFAVVRYNSDGSLDTTFNTTGKLVTAIGTGNDYGGAVVIQADGKIVVAGSSWNGANDDFALVRYWP